MESLARLWTARALKFWQGGWFPLALELCRAQGLAVNLFETSYFLSRETIVPTRQGAGMAHWREALFATLSRNAGSVVSFLRLPNNCVIELGTRVQI